MFADKSDEYGLSKEAYYFMGGLMKHISGIAAITNPLVNSQTSDTGIRCTDLRGMVCKEQKPADPHSADGRRYYGH